MILLSPSQAAQLFGVSERSIRRALVVGELHYTISQGRYKINFDDLLRWSEKFSSRIQKRDQLGIGQYVEKWKMPRGK